MIAEFPVLWNKEAFALLRTGQMRHTMVLLPETDWPWLFDEGSVDRNLNVLEFLIKLLVHKGADHQLNDLDDRFLGGRDPKKIHCAPISCPSR